MAIPAAQGGSVYIAAVGQQVTGWQSEVMVRDADVTLSGSGAALYLPVVPDASASLDFPMDDPNFPEVLGWTPGAVLASVYLKHGGSGKADKFVNTLVSRVAKSAAGTQDVPRVSVSIKGGTPSYNVVAGTG